MKRFAQFIALAVVLVLTAQTGRYAYFSAEEAALSCSEVQECIDNGYVMDSCVEQPIMYFVAPTGEYEWGQVNIRMSQMCQPPIYITTYIQAKERRGILRFRESHTTVVQ